MDGGQHQATTVPRPRHPCRKVRWSQRSVRTCHTRGNRCPQTLVGFRTYREREARSQSGPIHGFLTIVRPLLEHAIHALIRRWRLSPQAASTALLETAAELGVETGDLAALVLASEQRQRAQHPSRTRGRPDGVRKRALFVVGDETAAAFRPSGREPYEDTTSWAMRDPHLVGSPSRSHRSRRVGVSVLERPEPLVEVRADAAGSASEHVNDPPLRRAPTAVAWTRSDPGFSARESSILVLLTQGLSNQQIADASFLSINSVKTYIRSAYRKIDVQTRTQALLWGMDHGLRPAGAGRTWEPAAPLDTCRSAPAAGE
jgi:DNA-binding CsgD family transcriptional regulator